MYDDFGRIRQHSEAELQRLLTEKNLDGTRIMDVSSKIRTILDTGTAEEIAFLQAMLDAVAMVLPHFYEIKRATEKNTGENHGNE